VDGGGAKTVIVDIDAHHGNGTEEIFYGRSDILLIDIHESGLYTGTGRKEDRGAGMGEKYTVNIPVPPHSGDKTYRKAMDEIVIPIIRQFGPELIVVSFGVDAHYCDASSGSILSTDGYIGLCRSLINESKDGKIAFILEGGYHLRATAEVVAGVMAALEGRTIRPEYNEMKPENQNGAREVRKIREYIGADWDLGTYE
jgi:acetoin utilization deacetylase AcuC-like enzyme